MQRNESSSFQQERKEYQKMRLKTSVWAVFALLAMGCSSDDNVIQEQEETPIASFQVIGEDANSVFQYAYNAENETEEFINLTTEIGVSTGYLTLRQIDEFLSFYSFSQGAFSLDIKNIRSGAVANYVDFYVDGPERSLVWGTNTLTNVFFGYFQPGSSRVLGLQDVEIQNQQSVDVTIDFDINLLFQPILFDEKVYISFLDNKGNYKLTVYDTTTKTLGTILNFDTTPISILIDETGNLAVVKNGANATIELYDADSLFFISMVELGFNSSFSPGPLDGAVLQNNKLYYPLPFVQPARFSAGPAIFDLETQENFAIDLVAIADTVEEEIGKRITISTQVFSSSKNRFFVGYALLETAIEGGVLQISTDGELISNTSFPFFPTDIVFD
ncbi:hypothetical protein [Croceitalea rosinachiae]|uniref:Uncharacterized protein n=1 Tax=Croceitalea rosinachiae TaxID=3075596 RepID=A0ABU3A7J7_9FLAO|nr:hypothetical protein [Croceitalea sp. F388]MDT0606139.1 hypothetical protein [Croceitalea sp. F388]